MSQPSRRSTSPPSRKRTAAVIVRRATRCVRVNGVRRSNARPIGFAKGTLHDGGVPGFQGELNKIYVLRDWHRQGIGRALVERVSRRFLSEGVTSMLLFGDARNPSNGFYERLGAERLLSTEGKFDGGYGWRDLRSVVSGAGNE